MRMRAIEGRVSLIWKNAAHTYTAVEPTGELIDRHVQTLLDWYNRADNATMMGGSAQMTTADVRDFWREIPSLGGYGFLLFVDSDLVGDADLRNVESARCGFATMIGARERQGQGLGLTFATMVHVFAFRDLSVARSFVDFKKNNVRVQKMNERLGYQTDDTPDAWRDVDEEDCIPMSLTRERFRELHEEMWQSVAFSSSVP